MLKLLLCACAVALCTAFAYLLTRNYKKRRDFFYAVCLFNERLVNEVSYTKVPLPAFLEKNCFGGDLGKILRERCAKGESADFSAISYLREDEKQYLADYFGMIGKSDAQSQRTYLLAARAGLEERRRAGDEAYRKYFSLYLKLGVLAGLILVILIL